MTEPGSNDAPAVTVFAPATDATYSSVPMQASSESEGQSAAPAGTGAGKGQTSIAEQGSASTDAAAQGTVPAAAGQNRGRVRKDDKILSWWPIGKEIMPPIAHVALLHMHIGIVC